jgi:signal transduction histidine kinase
MRKAIGKMQNLIDDLLDLSRVNRKGKPFRKTDLAVTVREVVADLHRLSKKTGGQVNVGDMPVVEADESQIQKLIFNLVENGLKFHRENVPPVIRIAWQPVDAACYEITVEDNGIGIKEEALERIFGVFQRLSRGDEASGTGMGLALAKKIAERHGGGITVESTPGTGSTFRVKLPFSIPVVSENSTAAV